ncbi:hypothetical protein [Burkholderia gladioli]|uniref:hypothetical protein n=1 Tax=Burkholderia gladioli TaxID=28095 RepID=UPI001640D6D2|nr:hypothetical protein [Burkholderia gladioli]
MTTTNENSKPADGGPAFPVPGLQHDADFNGMSLRDRFAIAALPQIQFSHHGEYSMEAMATLAYQQADALLKARG